MSVYKWDGTGALKGFWTNWDEFSRIHNCWIIL